MVCIVTGIVTTGAVLIVRPLTRRLGALLEVMTQDRIAARQAAPDAARVGELLAGIDARLSRLEERQDFAEALISATAEPRLELPLPPASPPN